MSARCADASRSVGEQLAGTGIVATRWLLAESRVGWGRDAIATGFPADVARWLAGQEAKVLAIRRPGRAREPVAVYAVETRERGSTMRRLSLERIEDVLECDPWSEGEQVSGPLLLVCTHGRRDACCSRLGIPVAHALEALIGPERVWQCSHTGGHRFAANVIGLPDGVTLGRVEPDDAPEVVGSLKEGRLPVRLHRGRSLYPAAGQAAEVAIRRAQGLDGLSDLRLVGCEDARWTFALADGATVAARVTSTPGPVLPLSCGAEPEPTTTFHVELEST